MLRFLSVSRLAVIATVEAEFGPGLTVLTGETGAGKSILVGAIDLLLGGRASADLVRTGADTAQIQAMFETVTGEEVIVRREISAAGRSRAFVNGELVTSAALRDVTGPLVDLHGQHEHQSLLDPARHLSLLDGYLGLEPARATVSSAFDALCDARAAVGACRLDDRERAARLDLASFQLAEIDRVAPVAGEDAALEDEKRVLANADRLHRQANEAYVILYEGDASIIPQLGHVSRRLADLASLDGRFAPYLQRRDTAKAELEDLAQFLQRYLGGLEASPERLQDVEDRLASLERVKRRHGPTLDDVLQKRRQLTAEIEALTLTADRLADLERSVARAEAEYLLAADGLSSSRRAGANGFAARLSDELQSLALGKASCEFRVESHRAQPERWNQSGIDGGELYFAPNVGEAPRPLARIASGGEMSRVMLGIKTLVSVDARGKTLVFDEVDSGIGGRAADAVGSRLRALGRSQQVLCITHLPQVAAHASTHFVVEKSVRQARTVATLARLDVTARIEELARMIGGAEVTSQVRASAKEMLASRAKGEALAKGESERAKAKG